MFTTIDGIDIFQNEHVHIWRCKCAYWRAIGQDHCEHCLTKRPKGYHVESKLEPDDSGVEGR